MKARYLLNKRFSPDQQAMLMRLEFNKDLEHYYQWYEERAAILEFDNQLYIDEAEVTALQMTLEKMEMDSKNIN